MRVVVDTETDGIVYTKIWCAVALDLDTGKEYFFSDEVHSKCLPLKRLVDLLKKATEVVGHNFIGFDKRVIKDLLGYDVPVEKITDTLILSKLYNPVLPEGHSMEAYGRRFKQYKQEHEDWSQFSEEMLERCRTDCQLNKRMLDSLTKRLSRYSYSSIRSEHIIADIIATQNQTGVAIDLKKVSILNASVSEKLTEIEEEIYAHFKPMVVPVRLVEPKYKKDGSMSIVGLKKVVTQETLDLIGGPFTLIDYEEFNLNSPKQIIKRLDKIGWAPYVKTDGHIAAEKEANKRHRSKKAAQEAKAKYEAAKEFGWKICEENLDTISKDAPSVVHKLKEWKVLYSRKSLIEKQWLPNIGSDGRLHGYCDHLGAVTNRMTHNSPNLANIPALQMKKLEDGTEKPMKGYEGLYSYETRECFTVSNKRDYVLFGTDASGLELRCLCHYMDDPVYTDIVVNGDPHNYNRELIGLESKAQAKTFIYATLYGAGFAKIGSIVKGSVAEGKRLRQQFEENLPAYKSLMDRVQASAASGKIVGLDGRLINVRAMHSALNSLLQSAGAIICKYWLIYIMQMIKKYDVDARLVLSVHDEYQFEVHKNDVNKLVKIVKKSMKMVQKKLNIKVDLDCDYKVGYNWAETH